MSNPTPSFSVNVDVTNPGQFFACCGLLELAHRLWPGAEGWFDFARDVFRLRVADSNATLRGLIDHLATCGLRGLTEAERSELAKLEHRKRDLRKSRQDLPKADEQRRTELGKQAREGRLIVGDFQLVLDWWQDDGTPATWAGKQEIHKIARAAQNGVKDSLRDGAPVEDLLNWHRVLRMPAEYASARGADKKVEPFYFDARRYAHPLDEGFSLDVQEAETDAHPATEFLCLIGLQRFRPRGGDSSKWSFEYCAWAHALGAQQAAAVATGLAALPGVRRFLFALRFRDDQKRYKAFDLASCLGVTT